MKLLPALLAFTLLVPFAGLRAAAENYSIDPVHSTVGFKIRHLGISWVTGSFGKFEGTASFDPAQPASSTLAVTVQADSVNTGNADRDKHLRAEDFFHTEKHPTITFKSTKVVKKTDSSYEVTGDMTLLGTTKPVTFTVETTGPVQGMKGETRRGGETTLTVKRSDFGMKNMIGPIGDEVHVTLAFSAVKQ